MKEGAPKFTRAREGEPKAANDNEQSFEKRFHVGEAANDNADGTNRAEWKKHFGALAEVEEAEEEEERARLLKAAGKEAAPEEEAKIAVPKSEAVRSPQKLEAPTEDDIQDHYAHMGWKAAPSAKKEGLKTKPLSLTEHDKKQHETMFGKMPEIEDAGGAEPLEQEIKEEEPEKIEPYLPEHPHSPKEESLALRHAPLSGLKFEKGTGTGLFQEYRTPRRKRWLPPFFAGLLAVLIPGHTSDKDEIVPEPETGKSVGAYQINTNQEAERELSPDEQRATIVFPEGAPEEVVQIGSTLQTPTVAVHKAGGPTRLEPGQKGVHRAEKTAERDIKNAPIDQIGSIESGPELTYMPDVLSEAPREAERAPFMFTPELKLVFNNNAHPENIRGIDALLDRSVADVLENHSPADQLDTKELEAYLSRHIEGLREKGVSPATLQKELGYTQYGLFGIFKKNGLSFAHSNHSLRETFSKIAQLESRAQ